MLSIVYTRQMKRDAKRMEKRGKNMAKLTGTLAKLAARQPLPPQIVERKRPVQSTGLPSG